MTYPIEPVRTTFAPPIEPAERTLRDRDDTRDRREDRREDGERRDPAEPQAVAEDGHIDVRA